VIKLELPLNPAEPEVYILGGKKLLMATIPPNDGPIYQAGGIFWVRQGTRTRAVSMAELSEMIYDRGLHDWEIEPAYNATMDDMDLERVNIFLAQRAPSGQRSSRFKNIERVLVGMRCAVEVDGIIVPTNAGILFFGQSPQDHLPLVDMLFLLHSQCNASTDLISPQL
jgi:predicted HTH transcriptional regulator